MLCTIPSAYHALLEEESPLAIAPCDAILAHYDRQDDLSRRHYPQRCLKGRCIIYHGSICLESEEGVTTPAIVWFHPHTVKGSDHEFG